MNKSIKTNNDVSDIVWIQTAFLGDIILSTGAFKLLHEIYPEKKQYLITTKIGKMALESSPYLEKIICFDKKGFGYKSMKDVKDSLCYFGLKKKSTIVLQPHKSIRSTLLSKFLGYYSVSFKEAGLSFLNQRTFDRIAVFHESKRIAMLLQALGISRDRISQVKPSLSAIELDCSVSWQKQVASLIKPIIAIVPGSVWGTKRWLPDYFKELINIILKEKDYEIVILGGKNEVQLANEIIGGIDDSGRVINLAGLTSLNDLRRIYPLLKSIVTNDSSSIHYASAFDVPTVAIFGATVPEMGFGPVSSKYIVCESKKLECRPCSDHGPQVCPKTHFNCMKNVEVVQVYKALTEMMD